MKTLSITIATVAILASAPALAFGDIDNSTTNAPVANSSASAGAIAGAAAINSNRIGVDVGVRNRVSNTVRNSVNNSNRQGQHQGQGQGQRQSANNEGVTGNDVTVQGDVTKVEAAAMAPALAALTASNGTCLGSMTAGGAVPGFSLGVGSTVEDEQCTLRANIGVVMGLANILDDERLVNAALTMVRGLDGFPAAATAPVATGAPVNLLGTTTIDKPIEVSHLDFGRTPSQND